MAAVIVARVDGSAKTPGGARVRARARVRVRVRVRAWVRVRVRVRARARVRVRVRVKVRVGEDSFDHGGKGGLPPSGATWLG